MGSRSRSHLCGDWSGWGRLSNWSCYRLHGSHLNGSSRSSLGWPHNGSSNERIHREVAHRLSCCRGCRLGCCVLHGKGRHSILISRLGVASRRRTRQSRHADTWDALHPLHGSLHGCRSSLLEGSHSLHCGTRLHLWQAVSRSRLRCETGRSWSRLPGSSIHGLSSSSGCCCRKPLLYIKQNSRRDTEIVVC